MSEVPQNISLEHLLKALEEIDRVGVPVRAQSSSYDVVHDGKHYPPKLLVSIANRYANGVELSRQAFRGGLNTDAFNLLQRHGLHVEPKHDAFEATYLDLRARFLGVFPGFTGFDKDERYYDRERTYKDEFLEVYRRSVQPAVERKDWLAVGKGVLALLMKPLASNDKKPQNIVGWRYFEPLRKSSPENLALFGSAVGSLLDESRSVQERVGPFVDVLRKIVGEGGPSFPATSRSLTGFILTVGNPDVHLFLKTNETQRVMRLFEPSFSWRREGLEATELEAIEALGQRLHERLGAEGWRPKDLIDVQSFLWVAATYPQEVVASSAPQPSVEPETLKMAKPPLNQVLYGPPGTGKTYQTVNKALEVLDPDSLIKSSGDRSALKRRFDELRRSGRIEMVTFHQSFSYEDFVEGLRASVNEGGQVRYDVEDGIFKRICSVAQAKVAQGTRESLDPRGRRIWKMSLGNTLGDDAYIYDECIESNMILLGYGRAVDYSGASSRELVRQRHKEGGSGSDPKEFSVSAVHRFVNEMKKGDLVVVSDGNQKFRAIGEITGDYRHLDREDDYVQSREIRWLRVYSPSLPRDQLMDRVFSQMTIYELSPSSINLAKLAALLRADALPREPDAWVLIIDELNRGNVANIFGELITLIEDDRRIGRAEETTVRLPYSKVEFGVPGNLYIICTMNTADRSLVHLDTALRRRFVFEALMPDPGVLSRNGIDEISGVNIVAMLETINRRIELLYDREHTLGHSFFLPLTSDPTIERLARIFEKSVLPLLEEYFFEDWSKIRQILGDDQKSDDATCFVRPAYSESEIANALGTEIAQEHSARAFVRNLSALRNPDAYRLIYERDEA